MNHDDMEKLEGLSINELIRYFEGPSAAKQNQKAVNTARLAVATMSAIGRLKATMRVKDATQLMVIKNIAADRKEFRKFVAKSLPHLMPTKLLTRPEKI